MSGLKELKERCYEANLEIPRQGLAIYTFGNVSAFDREKGVFAIKPSGVPYGELRAEDMVAVDLEGRVVEGRLKPSSDTPTHRVLYEAFPHLGGVAHTHSSYATAWAQARRPVPITGTTHADHLAGDIPVTEEMDDEMIAGEYEVQTGRQILRALERQGLCEREVQMILVASHGPFTWGESPEKAVYNAAVLEELCRMALLTEQIAPEAGRMKQALIEKHYLRKHGGGAYYGQG